MPNALAEPAGLGKTDVLQTIIDFLPSGVTLFDPDLQMIACNEQFKRLLDFPPALFADGLPSMYQLAIYNARRGDYGPGDHELLAHEILERARAMQAHVFERTRPNGTVLEIRGTPLPDQRGFVTIYTDITERIGNEKLIREVKNLMSDAINFSPTFIWETDLEGNFTFLQGIEKILGFSSSELVGCNRYECFVHDAESVRALQSKMAAHLPFDQNVIAANKRNGERVWLSSSAQAVFDQQGEFAGYRGVDVDITELTRARQELEQMALHDALTGLANRRKFQLHYELEVLRQQRSGNPLVLLIIDIDHFKAVNDSYGHIVGDTCLKAIANTLVGNARAVDLVARFGGEEFLVLLADTAIDEGLKIAEKLRAAVENLQVRVEGAASPLRITISTGLAAKNASTEMPLDSLIERADAGVYRAKDGGRNRVCLGN